jgi:hypothetical protein
LGSTPAAVVPVRRRGERVELRHDRCGRVENLGDSLDEPRGLGDSQDVFERRLRLPVHEHGQALEVIERPLTQQARLSHRVGDRAARGAEPAQDAVDERCALPARDHVEPDAGDPLESRVGPAPGLDGPLEDLDLIRPHRSCAELPDLHVGCGQRRRETLAELRTEDPDGLSLIHPDDLLELHDHGQVDQLLHGIRASRDVVGRSGPLELHPVSVPPLVGGARLALDLVAGVREEQDVTVGKALGDLIELVDRDRLARAAPLRRPLADVRSAASQAEASAREEA